MTRPIWTCCEVGWVVGIDPGPEVSALAVIWPETGVAGPITVSVEAMPNDVAATILDDLPHATEHQPARARTAIAEAIGHLPFLAGDVVFESVESYGMPVGREVFDTVRCIGRLEERVRLSMLREPVVRCARIADWPRRKVKQIICGTVTAKDTNIRRSLLDMWGGAVQALGRKAQPGPLYRVTKDGWAALAVAVSWAIDKGIVR